MCPGLLTGHARIVAWPASVISGEFFQSGYRIFAGWSPGGPAHFVWDGIPISMMLFCCILEIITLTSARRQLLMNISVENRLKKKKVLWWVTTTNQHIAASSNKKLIFRHEKRRGHNKHKIS